MTNPTPTSTPILHARYRIEEKLGTGRLAAVYRAYDERLQRPVLVHMLRKELLAQEPLRRRFQEEAHASARRSHQSLLEVFDSGEVAGRPYLITEYVSGRTIRELGALSLEEALLYFRQLVGAVATCQAAGVPHPPITSNNLILVGDGHVELLENWMTSAAEVALDVASYRAPERVSGQPITPTSTVYALGLLLFEMLTGRRAVTGDDPRTVSQAHLTTRIPLLSEVRPTLYLPALERLLQRATARQPELRLPDAAALGAELDRLRREISGDTQRLATPPVRQPSLRERINRTAAEVVPRRAAVAPPDPLPEVVPERLPPRPANRVARDRGRTLQGIVMVLGLFMVVSCGAYYLASLAVERFSETFRLPRPSINLPNVFDGTIDLPEWLTGVVGGQGELLLVAGVPELNLRAEPGLNTQVIGQLPSGSQVRRLGGQQVVDNVPWLQVRGRARIVENGETIERELDGWVSANYVRTLTGDVPAFEPVP